MSRSFSSQLGRPKRPEDLEKLKDVEMELKRFEFEPFKFNVER